jgi:hypothetical protein
MNPIIKPKAWELKSYITMGSQYCLYIYIYICLEKSKIIFGNVYLTYIHEEGRDVPKKNQSDLRFGNTPKLATTSMDPKSFSFSIFNKLWLFWGHPK